MKEENIYFSWVCVCVCVKNPLRMSDSAASQ